MAPPGKRRGGFSRKAQYGLFAGYVIAIGGALLALLLVATARLDPVGNNAVRAALTDLTSPVSQFLGGIVRGVGSAITGVSDYIDAGSKNAALRAERDANRRKLVEARVLAYENARLKQLLGIARSGEAPVATGRLASSSASSTRRFAILDTGSASGVLLGQPVRGPEGLVGRIVEAGLVTSRVQLIADSGVVVPVIRVPDGFAAFVLGTGGRALEIRPGDPGRSALRPGDLFVTSGAGGIYPPRIPVAMVTRVAGDKAYGRAIADPAKLDYAAVLPAWQPLAAIAPPPKAVAQ